jgi:hypothetical protein
MAEQEQMSDVERQQLFVTSLLGALAKFANAPTKEQIEAWKLFYDVMASGLDDDEIYLWRPITRKEWKELRAKFMLQAQQTQQNPPEGAFEEAIVDACILWASDPAALQKKAGSYEVLHDQIALNSNFINANMAAQLVVKL